MQDDGQSYMLEGLIEMDDLIRALPGVRRSVGVARNVSKWQLLSKSREQLHIISLTSDNFGLYDVFFSGCRQSDYSIKIVWITGIPFLSCDV